MHHEELKIFFPDFTIIQLKNNIYIIDKNKNH